MHKYFIAVFLVATLAFAGCNGKPDQSRSGQGSKVLAKVNGTPISAADVAYRHQEGHSDKPQYGDRSLDDAVNQELLYQQGLKLGLDKDPSYRSKLSKLNSLPSGAKRQEMARRVFNTQIAATINVTHQAAKEYYDKNADRIATELHLEMIKFDKRQEAEEALQKLHNGATIESIARPVMGEALVNGRKPWDLGFVNWDNIPVEFVDPIYQLKPGEVSDILGSQRTGFQITKLIASRKIAKPGYSAISSFMMNRLRDLKLLEAYNQYIDQLRKNADIEKF